MPTLLEEHAEASAEKKGLEGEARRRYIGGIFEKVRQAHAKATPEQREKFKEKVSEKLRQVDEKHKQRREEDERRKAHPMGGQWLIDRVYQKPEAVEAKQGALGLPASKSGKELPEVRGTRREVLKGYWEGEGTKQKEALRKEQRAEEQKAAQQEQGNLIAERTEEKRAKEAYSRLLAKYHNPNLAAERAAGLQEYQQLEQDRRKARYNRFGRGKSAEEERIQKQMKALDSKYGITEEYESKRQVAEAAERERQRQEAEARQRAEEERRKQQERDQAAHMARRDNVLKERDTWRNLSEPEVKKKEKAFADEWDKASKERDRLRTAGQTSGAEWDKNEQRYDLARLRYQFIDSVLAEKRRPAIEAEQKKAYQDEYLAYLKAGRAGKKPREGYAVNFDDARKIRGEALKAFNAEQKASGKPAKPTIPPNDTKASVQDAYNRFYLGLHSDREKKLANFYVEKAMGKQPAERDLIDMQIPPARRKMIQEKASALGQRSAALLESERAK